MDTTASAPGQQFERIIRVPGVRGGDPVIKGTSVPVWIIAALSQRGADTAEILAAYPHLTAPDVAEALTYYAANRADIDRRIAEEEDDASA